MDPDQVTVRNIEDFDAVKSCMEEHETTMLVNLAAQTGISLPVEDPMADFSVNVLGTLNVLVAARQSS